MNTITIVLLCALLMMLVELKRPGRAFAQTKFWWLRSILLNMMQASVVLFGAVTWDTWLPSFPLNPGDQWTLSTQVVAGYLLVTFVYYWWHRARHEISILWRWLHQLHHSPSRIEIITSFYKHPIEVLVNGFLSSFILYVLLGISAEATAITVLVTGLAELFYHWNVRTPYWLGFFFQRPEMHCVHHQRGHHNKNYSDLPLWDMMFGTFENPKANISDCGLGNNRELLLKDMLLGRDVTASNKGVAHE